MGLLDKAKFWKKEDELGDLSDLGDFGLEEKPGAPGGELPPMGGREEAGMMPGAPAPMEEVPPTPGSKEMGEQLGLKPAPPEHAALRPAAVAQPAMPSGPGIGDLAKDIEIMNAKLDAIKASLDSISQRLATLERMASSEGKTRSTW